MTKKKTFLIKMSGEYEGRGLTEVLITNDQIGALHAENNRERIVNESLLRDVAMLRE